MKTCLCNHRFDRHARASLRCLVPGCRCTLFEWDPIGLPETPHSQHTTPVLGCFSCEDDLADARQLEHDQPWNDGAPA